MARVPVPAAGPGTELRPVTAAKFDAQDQTAGLRQVGGALQQAGEFGFQYASEQDKIDQTLDRAAVKQADTLASQKLRDRLWTADNAFYKQQGFNAANARPQVEKDLQAVKDELRAGLTTDRQRGWFDQAWEQRAGQEAEGISRYVTGQVQVEERKQSLARITESSNDAITYWNDPVRRDTAIATAIAETRSQAATAGWAPEVAAQAERDARSGIYARAIGGMIDRGEVENAQAELIRNRDVLDPDSEVKLDAALRGPLLDRQAESVVDDLMGTAAPIETVTATAQATGQVLPRMAQITAMAESGGRETGRDGRRITSPKGAAGIMQVMPGTQRDPGFGVKPSNGTAEDDARVGRDYLAVMMKRYGNDPAKAWAAYNWGPGNLDKAIAANGPNWLQNAPAETRAYVRGNMGALGGRGTNAPVQQRPAEHDMTTLLARVDQLNLPFDVEQKVRARLTQRVALDEGLLSRQREQAQEQAWGTVEALGDKFTSVDQLPTAVRSQLTPQQRLQFDAVAKRNTTQGTETDWQAYSRFSDMAGTDPRGFVALNPAEMKAKLSNSDFEQFMGMRRSIQSALGQNRKAPEQVTLSRVKDVTDPLLAAAGITRPPDPAGAAKTRDPAADQAYWARIGKFQRRMSDDVSAWQERHPGEQIDDNTIRNLADRGLLRMWERDRSGNKADRGFAFEQDGTRGSLGYSAPTADINRIRTAYRARWGRNPTEQEVDSIYRYGPRGGR